MSGWAIAFAIIVGGTAYCLLSYAVIRFIQGCEANGREERLQLARAVFRGDGRDG